MPFPQTEKELVLAGYRFEKLSICQGCRRDIEWWRTPAGKLMPLNLGTVVPHWSTCLKADQFRKRKPGSTPVIRKNNGWW